ncbi:MAG: hypothetical protein ACK5NT_01915 [Pyrinomonadaceae bacterium]
MNRLTLSALIFGVVFSTFMGCNYFTSTENANTPQDTASENQTANAGQPTMQGDDAETGKEGSVKATGVCANDYYPVDSGLDQTYSIKGSKPGTFIVDHKDVDAESFKEIRSFSSGIVLTTNWTCTPEGLRNAEYQSSADLGGGQLKMETLSSSGVTIPKKWEAGKTYTAEYKIRATMMGRTFDGTATIDNKITSLEENISVQGGDFVAARVESTIKVNLNGVPGFSASTVNWFAPDVGLVKQEATSRYGKENIEYTGEK